MLFYLGSVMTTKEIAAAVGKDERSVQRWVKSISDKMSSISDKMSSSTSTNPADYTLEETCQIIETGMGKDVADVFRTNAKKPEKIILDPKSIDAYRRLYSVGAISLDELRIAVGFRYPKSDMLDPAIAKQVYAVTCSAIERKKQQKMLEDSTKKLDFNGGEK